jgi:glycosyltransferase EpsE
MSAAFRPVVSVIMGAYNCASVLPAALASLREQTFQDWELVVCEDGSSDDTWGVLSAFAEQSPEKVILLRNERNRGLAYSLNRCIEAARGDFLARQDGDDMSVPTRFAIQLDYLRANTDMGWVSTAVSIFDERGDVGIRRSIPDPTKKDLVRGACFVHAATMFRAEVMRSVGRYSVAPYIRQTEDYDLWMRLFAAGWRGHNLQDVLYRVREDRNAYGRKTFDRRLAEAETRYHGYRAMGMPLRDYAFVLRPLVIGLLPTALLRRLHEARVQRSGGATR